MQSLPVEPAPAPPPDAWVPPVPEFVDIPADLPVLEPSVTITLPLNEQITSAVVVPDEHEGADVLYVAVTQERVNVWAAVVYFVPEIALGLTALLILVALRKLWVGRRFLHRKGEAYCKKCWAGLTGVQSETCPECGRPVAKTKRVAKRSRRSPLSPLAIWPYLALVAALGTGVLWFGESWHWSWTHGFDCRQKEDWLNLVVPLEEDSVFRINPVAKWFGWHSPGLSALARNNDHSWIDEIENAYHNGEGIQNRILVRRYASGDGQRLSEHKLPDSSQWQDSVGFGEAWFSYIANTLIVSDGDHYFGFRHDADEPWLKYETDNPDEYRTIAGISPDGEHIVIGFNDFDYNAFGPADSQRLIAFNVHTGNIISVLDLMQPEGRYTTLRDQAELHDFLMTETDDQVVLCLFQPSNTTGNRGETLVIWDFVDETISPVILDSFPHATLCSDHMLEYDYPWSIKSIHESPNVLRGSSRIMHLIGHEGRFDVWQRELQRRGQILAWLPIENRRYWFANSHNTPTIPPYDKLNPNTDFPLYEIDTVTSTAQPNRVLQYQPTQLIQTLTDLCFTQSGRSAIAEIRTNSQHLWLDIDTARATASLHSDPNADVLYRSYSNDEGQYIICIERWITNAKGGVIGYQPEILIFDLPE